MKTTLFVLALASLPACTLDEGGDRWSSVGDETGGGDTGSNQDSGGGATCNDANESCGPSTCSGEGGSMLPGANCLSCHTGGEQGKFTVAGTVFTDGNGSARSSGAVVTITDASGHSINLTTNSVGNFYTSQSVTFPITATVEQGGFTSAMGTEVSSGACNSCHQCGGSAGGKLYSE
jgi:hypothetical protein